MAIMPIKTYRGRTLPLPEIVLFFKREIRFFKPLFVVRRVKNVAHDKVQVGRLRTKFRQMLAYGVGYEAETLDGVQQIFRVVFRFFG